jgi:hypothetical protein
LNVNAVLAAMTVVPAARASASVKVSVMPSAVVSCAGSPVWLTMGMTTMDSGGGSGVDGWSSPHSRRASALTSTKAARPDTASRRQCAARAARRGAGAGDDTAGLANNTGATT